MVSIRGIFKRDKKESDAKSGINDSISDREIKNWFEDGLKKGYRSDHLRDILINKGFRKEAYKLLPLYKTHFPKKKKTGALLLFASAFMFALFFALVFIQSNGNQSNEKLILSGNIISEGDNPGAIVNVNFSNNIGVVRDDFYGVNSFVWGSNLSFIDSNGDGILDTYSDYEWHREKLQEAGLNYWRVDMVLGMGNSDGTFWTNNLDNWGNINTRKNLVEYAKTNNIKIVFVASYMPPWLANKTSGYCNSSLSNPGVAWATCTPTNYSRWGQLVTDYLKYVDCDANTCEVEVWNEPSWYGFYLNNLSNINPIRSIEYNKLYNATYLAVKSVYPTMQIGGPATAGKSEATNLIMFNWMSNFSHQIDFVSYHDYLGQEIFTDFYSALSDDYSWIYGNITAYSVNTSRILIDEYNVWDDNIKVNHTNQWTIQMGLAYLGTLNTYPANVSLLPFDWAESKNRSLVGTYWQMVSEPQLDNAYYASYNVTKNFATYHSSGSTVVKSNSTLNNIKVVASKKNSLQYITVINTGDEVDLGLNIFGDSISNITDLETNETYNVTDDGVYIGPISQYQIRYFVILNNSASSEEELEQLSDNNTLTNGEDDTIANEEPCNSTTLNQTCEGLGYSSGILSYKIGGCTFDTSQCINNSNNEENINTASIVNGSNETMGGKKNNGIESNQKTSSLSYFILFSLIMGISILIFYVGRVLVRVKKHDSLRTLLLT
jgi:hypothetical protein